MTGTSFLHIIYIVEIDVHNLHFRFRQKASTWMSKVCYLLHETEFAADNPCSPRVKFSAKVGEPFNACGNFSMEICDYRVSLYE